MHPILIKSRMLYFMHVSILIVMAASVTNLTVCWIISLAYMLIVMPLIHAY